jgi:hypothetical protein
MRVLCHLSTFISIEEDVVNVERSGNKRLLVSSGDGPRTCGSCGSLEGFNSPETLTDRADIKIDFNFVVLYEPLKPPLSRYLTAYHIV